MYDKGVSNNEDYYTRTERYTYMYQCVYGSRFMELLLKEVAKKGCDSVLLGTQKGYPSHQFYLKNGFEEIESVLLYKEVK